ncbi:MAG: YkgJ family cysteine cluster protein, partial [Deltaproteobacteria bacterium]|nr:YkgJ family cysteine cluster protein [Deltaproteobacteria bacterium]
MPEAKEAFSSTVLKGTHMANDPSTADRDFFVVVLKEEAREALWKVGSSADPQSLVESVLADLEALAPGLDGTEDRSDSEIWKQVREILVRAAYATRPYCIRCGACCKTGSPILTLEDPGIFRKDLLKPEHLLTIRRGEVTYDSRTRSSQPAAHEMIKIREVPDSRACLFYDDWDKGCSIYEDRPHRCRVQECWNPEAAARDDSEPITRQDLLQASGALWDVIARHEERCSIPDFSRSMARLASTKGQTVGEIIEFLKYDQHVRSFISEKLNLAPETMDFFFGRPLRELVQPYGLKVEEQRDGSFLLTMAA